MSESHREHSAANPALEPVAGTCAAGKFLGVVDRHWWTGSAETLVAGVDALIAGGRIIKSGASTTVSQGAGSGRDILVKRYNHKGFFHALGTGLRGSRARRVWAHALALRHADIATPAPLAWFEVRHRGLIQASYLISEFLPIPTLHSLLLENRVSEDDLNQIRSQVRDLIERLHSLGFTHGDLKPTNILCEGTRPLLIDLDAMEAGARPRRFARRRAKDRAALGRRIEIDPAEYARRQKRELRSTD